MSDDQTITEEKKGLNAKLKAWLARFKAQNANPSTDVTPDKLALSTEQKEMLNNITALKETRIEDIMVPRADIISVSQQASLAEILEEFENSGRSRIIIYDDNLDDPLGHVHMKDVLTYMLSTAKKNQTKDTNRLMLESVDLNETIQNTKISRPVLFVPPSMPAVDLLEKMQATRMHLALVIDEYGGTDGLVTLADIVENIIGDIDDERDEEENLITEAGKDTYLADARVTLEELAEVLGENFAPSEEVTDEVSTLGGYLTHIKGYLPVRGEIVREGAFEFQVLDADPRRLKRLRIVCLQPPIKKEAKANDVISE
jgi:CBS domain containing-hemolysin-like protein